MEDMLKKAEDELAAMKIVADAMLPLSPLSRHRVLRWYTDWMSDEAMKAAEDATKILKEAQNA